ncbi:MAG: hypothetical protein AB1486_19240 [Planctomycetota bacterium]
MSGATLVARRSPALVWMCVGVGVFVFVVGGLFELFMADDAFITFQYSKQLARGSGFVFNPGERVLGTTTPLFALLGAVLYVAARLEMFLLANYLSVLCITLQGFFAWALFTRLGYGAWRWIVLLLPVVNLPGELRVPGTGDELPRGPVARDPLAVPCGQTRARRCGARSRLSHAI